MTPEGRVKKSVKKLLDQYEYIYSFMPVQTGYGASTLDFLLCVNGYFVAIETKTRGKSLTPRQFAVSEQMRAAGAVVLCINEDNLHKLRDVLDRLTVRKQRVDTSIKSKQGAGCASTPGDPEPVPACPEAGRESHHPARAA